MNSSFTYPVVSYPDIVNLFHAILFWRQGKVSTREVDPRRGYITFDSVWHILEMGQILTGNRIRRIRGNKELCRLFLAKALVVEQYDNRNWQSIFTDAPFKEFWLRKSNRELVSGNTVNRLELCSRTRIFLTPFGIRTAPDAVAEISRLLPHEQFLSLWERYIAPFLEHKKMLGFLFKVKNQRLNEEIWGDK